jgi:hypothetical protein
MTRAELIRLFVLNSCCDDYEDIVQITKHTDEVGPKCGMTVSEEDIIQALGELMELGYVRAWNLTPPPRPEPIKEYRGMPSPEEIAAFDPWFFRTEGGLAVFKPLSSDWLFDETNNLREVWIVLEASVKREEFVRLFVLDSVRDYRMTIGHIEKRRDALAKRCAITISRDEFIQALRELIELGDAKAYDLDIREHEPPQYDGMPPLEDIRPWCAYFMMTPEGLVVHHAEPSWWPFEGSDDGELKLREDWVPPDA